MILERNSLGQITKTSGRKKAHGWSRTLTYKTWQNMWQRCSNPKDKDYKYYGERGIQVDQNWGKFENFLRDMGKKPRGKTLDRVNNNWHYEFFNCRWATRKEQANNRRNRYAKNNS